MLNHTINFNKLIFCFKMLNCILSMVEKTKRALGILQHRGATENGHINSDWLPRREQHRPTNNPATSTEDVKRTASEIMAHTIRLTEDRVAEVKRKAGNIYTYRYVCVCFTAYFLHTVRPV